MSNLRRLLLVRHGLPDYGGKLPQDDFPGPPLSEIGRSQALQTAASLSSYGPLRVYTSPLVRTQQTADLIGRRLRIPVRVESALREWHHTEGLYEVSVRMSAWLARWLRGPETCAVAVSHASPLLALLRSALYLPHLPWHRPGQPKVLELSSGDRFEVSMGSAFELQFEPQFVTARCAFHPRPRVHHLRHGRMQPGLPRIMPGSRESCFVRRANWLSIIGYPRAGSARTQP